MTADNRANEPIDEQVEAAAKAALQVLKNQWPEEIQEGWTEEEMTKALELQRKAQRAALVAAQGAAPQAGEVQKPTENDQLPAESSIPVLPSSGVDEDAPPRQQVRSVVNPSQGIAHGLPVPRARD